MELEGVALAFRKRENGGLGETRERGGAPPPKNLGGERAPVFAPPPGRRRSFLPSPRLVDLSGHHPTRWRAWLRPGEGFLRRSNPNPR